MSLKQNVNSVKVVIYFMGEIWQRVCCGGEEGASKVPMQIRINVSEMTKEFSPILDFAESHFS